MRGLLFSAIFASSVTAWAVTPCGKIPRNPAACDAESRWNGEKWGGDPQSDVDLTACWKSNPQQSDKTCYAFTATGLIEAAINRRDGKLVKFSTNDATAHFLFTPELAQSWENRRRKINIEKQEYILDWGNTEPIVESMLRWGYMNPEKSEATSFNESLSQHVLTGADLRESQQIAVARLKRQDQAVSLESLRLKTTNFANEHREASALVIENLGIAGQIKRQQAAGVSPANVKISTRMPMDKVVQAPKLCAQASRAAVTHILNQLCRGIPMEASMSTSSLQTIDAEGVQRINFEGGSHSMIISGIETDPTSGEAYFVFKNSYGGNKKTRLPLTSACLIDKVSAVMLPGDPGFEQAPAPPTVRAEKRFIPKAPIRDSLRHLRSLPPKRSY